MNNEHFLFLQKYLLSKKINLENIYLYGSRIYNTSNSNSDYDYYALVSQNLTDQLMLQYQSDKLNIKIVSSSKFLELLNKCSISPLESYLYIYQTIQIDKKIFINSVIDKVNKDWKKAFSLIDSDEHYFEAIKIIFHALRILTWSQIFLQQNKLLKENFDFSNLYQELNNDIYTKEELNKLTNKFNYMKNNLLNLLTN